MNDEPYTPQRGDRVQRVGWGPMRWVDVLFVGDLRFFGVDNKGVESSHSLDSGSSWYKVEPRRPLPERWWFVNLVENVVGMSSKTQIWPG